MSVMRYGKFKGTDMSVVPETYLHNLLRSAQSTVTEISAELERRKTSPPTKCDGDGDRLRRLEDAVAKIAKILESRS